MVLFAPHWCVCTLPQHTCITTIAPQLRVPTDTLRHRVQAYLHPNVGAAACTIAANEGPRGLFRGFGPTIMRDVPEIALQFVVYDRYVLDTLSQGSCKACVQHVCL